MTVDLNRMLGQHMDPVNLLDLPRNLTGFERVNPFELNFDQTMTIGTERLDLVSAVSAKINNLGTSRTMKGFIIGNMAWVKLPSSEWACYDPRAVNKPGILRNDPRLGLSRNDQPANDAMHGNQGNADQMSIYSLRPMIRYTDRDAQAHLQKFGTIFVYANSNPANPNQTTVLPGNGFAVFHAGIGH